MKKGIIWAIAGIIGVYTIGLGLSMRIDSKDADNGKAVKTETVAKAEPAKEKLTVWYWDNALEEEFELFKEKMPNVELDYVHIPNFEYTEQLRNVLLTHEELPDICMLQDKFAGDFLAMDIWEDLEAEPYKLDKSVFPEYVQSYMTDAKGRIVAVPYNLAASGLAYRESLMKEVFGLNSPDEVAEAFPDWESLIAAGDAYRQKTGESFYLFSSLGDIATVLFYQTNDTYVKDNRLYRPERFLEYFEILHSLYDKGLVNDITQCSNKWYDEFENGSFMFSPWSMWLNQNKTFSRNKMNDWRLTVPPEGSYKWGAVVCALPKSSKHKETAWEFVKFLTMSDESAHFGKTTENSFFLCSKENAATDEYISLKLSGFGSFDVGEFYFKELMKEPYMRQLSPYDSYIDVAYHTAVKAIPKDPEATPQSSYDYFIELLKKSLPDIETAD